MTPLWRSSTGYFRLIDGSGQFLLEAGGRVHPVAISISEALDLRDALCRILPSPRRPGPTEYKHESPPASRRNARPTEPTPEPGGEHDGT